MRDSSPDSAQNGLRFARFSGKATDAAADEPAETEPVRPSCSEPSVKRAVPADIRARTRLGGTQLDPSLRNNIRLFFEVNADALRGRSYTKDFLDEVMSSWLL